MKMYEKPEFSLTEFKTEDIILLSIGGEGGAGNEDDADNGGWGTQQTNYLGK